MVNIVEWSNKPLNSLEEKYKVILENSFKTNIRRDRLSRDRFISTMVKITKGDVTKLDNPVWVGYKITNRCNLDCIHCWAYNKNYEPSKEEIFKAIDKLREASVYFVGLSGGELFTRRDIFEVLTYIKHKGMYIEIFTNATLLDEKKVCLLEEILDKDHDIIQISLDGASEETVYAQRKTKEFSKIVNNIKLLLDKGFKVRISYVATHKNVHDLFNTYKLVSDLGVDGFSVSPVYPKNKGIEIHKLLNMDLYYEEIFKCIGHPSDIELTYFLQIDFFNRINALVNKIDLKYKMPHILPSSHLSFYIDADGSVYPEFELDYEELKLGNIYEDSIEYIKENVNKIDFLTQGRNLSGTKCEKCKFISMCLEHSYEQSYEKFRDINKPNPYCNLMEG